MQEEQQIERVIHEVEHAPLSPGAAQKLEQIKALTGMSDAEVKAIAASRGVGSSFALSALAPHKLH